MYRTVFWTLWDKARVGCFKRTASKHVYYLGWNRSPFQVGCMRQALGPGALGRPRGIGWRGRWEGWSGWGTHVNPWLIHFIVWKKSTTIKKKKKDDAVKVLQSVYQQIWKTQQWPQDWKRWVFIPISKKGNAKECSNYCTTALISHASSSVDILWIHIFVKTHRIVHFKWI